MGVRDELGRLGRAIAAGAGVMITGRPFGSRSVQTARGHEATVTKQIGPASIISNHGITYIVQRVGLESGFTTPGLDSGTVYFRRVHPASPSSYLKSTDGESPQYRQLPDKWIQLLDGADPISRAEFIQWLSLHPSFDTQLPSSWTESLNRLKPGDRSDLLSTLRFYLESTKALGEAERPPDEVELSREELENVADSSEGSIDHALAMMFIRLGPPPEPTGVDYVPASNGGGGAQQ